MGKTAAQVAQLIAESLEAQCFRCVADVDGDTVALVVLDDSARPCSEQRFLITVEPRPRSAP